MSVDHVNLSSSVYLNYLVDVVVEDFHNNNSDRTPPLPAVQIDVALGYVLGIRALNEKTYTLTL